MEEFEKSLDLDDCVIVGGVVFVIWQWTWPESDSESSCSNDSVSHPWNSTKR